MARLTYTEFITIINKFVWGNLNKEITGDVLRQFIVNILQSVPEMKLLDGRTIEEAITELKNTASVGGGSSIIFSPQFKVEDNVVSLKLKYISANEDSASGSDDPEPEVPAQSFTIRETDTGISSWDAETKISLVFNELTGISTITALETWTFSGSYFPVRPLDLVLKEELLTEINTGEAGYLYVSFDLRVNDAVMNTLAFNKIGLEYRLNSGGGYYSLKDVRVGSEFTSLVFRITSKPCLSNPLLWIALVFGESTPGYSYCLPAGCIFEIKNVQIYKDVV